jgi:hypothetical protein
MLHEYNAAITCGDRIYAYEEDKLTGAKNDTTVQFAERSLLVGCKELDVTPNKIDYWVFPKPRNPVPTDGFF